VDALYSCSFCQHRAPKRGKRLNHHDPVRVFDEIDLFCRNGVQSIAILDPIFNVSPIATKVLERFVRNGFEGRISVQCRPELLKDDFLVAASQLDITLEFGLQTIHEAESEAVNRRNHLDKVEHWLARVRQLKIHHEVSLIFGLPEQTLASFKQSVDWCLRRSVPVIKAFPLMLLRGTELARQAEHWEMKQSDSKIPFVQSSSTFTARDWSNMNAISQALKATEGRHQRD
jgi:coproporphyrinogen III oxidase-like Fe-S oxidoreductase